MFYHKYLIFWKYWTGYRYVYSSDIYDGYDLDETLERWEQEYTGIYPYSEIVSVHVERNCRWEDIDI